MISELRRAAHAPNHALVEVGGQVGERAQNKDEQ
jgi:hypothetical protein